MFNSWRPHGLQHARLPCPSLSLRVCADICPLSQWCHPSTSSSATPLSSCPQSFPASRSFPMSPFLASGGQRIGASASASILPMNIQDWFPLGWTGLISLQSKGLSRVFSNTSSKASILQHSAFLVVQFSHPHMIGKNHSFDSMTFVSKVMSLLFNMLSFGAFPGGASGKEPACQCRRHKRCGFNPWVGKIHWRRKWQPTPAFLPGESHGQRSLTGYRVHEVTKSWTWLKWLSMQHNKDKFQTAFFFL